MIETRLLHYFLTVAREQNITNAAKALNITQPTLSRQMTCLEHQIGAQLFQRDSRPLVLTDEGVLLRRRAEEILELLEKTETEVTIREEQVEGTVYIGCGELGAVRVLSDLMTGFRQRHPRVVFDVYTTGTDRIKRRMDEGLTDIGLLLERRWQNRKPSQPGSWRTSLLSYQAGKRYSMKWQTGSASITINWISWPPTIWCPIVFCWRSPGSATRWLWRAGFPFWIRRSYAPSHYRRN